MTADERFAGLGLTLPPAPKPQGNYVPFRLAGNMLFLSGVGPLAADGSLDHRQGRRRPVGGAGV